MKKIIDGFSGKEITEEEAKKTACAEYQYDDPKEALVDLVLDNVTRKFHWETAKKIEEITEKINYKGVKLEGYFVWGKYVFLNLAGFYHYSGKTNE